MTADGRAIWSLTASGRWGRNVAAKRVLLETEQTVVDCGGTVGQTGLTLSDSTNSRTVEIARLAIVNAAVTSFCQHIVVSQNSLNYDNTVIKH